MNIFSLETEKKIENVFTFPVETPTFNFTENAQQREKILYPHLTGIDKPTVDAHVDSGIKGPIIQAAEGKSTQKEAEKIETRITEAAKQGVPYEEALDKFEDILQDDPFLKAVVSPATINALRQSENPIVRRSAQRKLGNTAIALELIQAKQEEANKEGFLTNFDFVDAFVSDLPFLSFKNLSDRKEWANQFTALLDSAEDPALVKSRMKELLDKAADQGLLTQSNRFYLGDFLDILQEGPYGTAATLQGAFATLDLAFSISTLNDAARLLAGTGKGKSAVKEALEDAVRSDSPVAGHTVPSNFEEGLGTPAGNRPTTRSPDEATAALELNIELKVSDDVLKIRKTSGQSFEDDAFEAFRADVVAKAKANAEKAGIARFIDADVTYDAFENFYLKEVFGTTKGKAFTSRTGAEKEANRLGGATVVEIGPKQFVVEKLTNLPTGEFYKGTSPIKIADELRLYRVSETDDLGYGVMAKYFYSPLSQTDKTRNAILKQGEASRAKALEDLDKVYLPVVKAAGKEGVQAVGRVLSDIRDGSRAMLRQDLTIPEFRGAFAELNKRMPTQAEEDLYALTIQRNIDDWYLTADMHLKREVNKGIQMYLVGELELAGVKASKGSANADRLVWDIEKGKYLKVSELDENKELVRLAEPTSFDGKFNDLIATNLPKTRALKHTDVLGYNPGGSRLYGPNQTNFLIKQDRTLAMADGTNFNATPTTIMVAKTEKEVTKALDEINSAILSVHKVIDPKPFTKADDYHVALLGKESDEALNEAIAKVSGWNPSVHSVRTLVEYFQEAGLDLRKTVDKVEDGQPIIRGDDLVGDMSFRDALSSPGTLRRGNVRRDKVLLGYGGSTLSTVPPMEAIQRSYMSSVARMTDVAYEASAINGLLRSAILKNLLSPKTLEEMRWLPLRQKLKYLDGKIPQGTEAGKKLELERQKILYRLEKRNYLDAAIQAKKDELSKAIYDAGWKKASEKIDPWSPEPVAAMRGITFDAMLGMFAWDQLYVQASHIINIMGTADRAAGLKAAMALPINRWLIRNGNKSVTEAMATRMAKALDITPKQFQDMLTVYRESGRNSVTASLADLGEDSAGKIALRKFREKGRFFYNEGERLARITAHTAASLEYIKKFGPEADLTTNSAKRWVTHREDTLTFAMTSQSRTAIEQFPMAQFMSYTFRMFEFLTSGLIEDFKNVAKGGSWSKEIGPLSLRHKVKLLTTQMAFYGAAAVPGVNYLMDNLNYYYGTNIDEGVVGVLTKGVLDSFAREIAGVESELGRRLAWGEGLWTTLQDIGEENTFELLAGPSYNVAKDVLTSTGRLARNVATGSISMLPEDLVDVARTLKSVNLTYNAWMAFNYGEYMTKNSTVVTKGLDPYEAAAIAFGVPLEQVNSVWRTREFISKDRKSFMDLAKVPSEIFREMAWEYEHNGFNTERADTLRKSLELFYAPLSPYERSQVDRYVDKKAISLFEKTVIDVMRTPYNFQEVNK